MMGWDSLSGTLFVVRLSPVVNEGDSNTDVFAVP